MSLFDIYKAKQCGIMSESIFDTLAGKIFAPVESFNKWDEEWEVGSFDNNTGAKISHSGRGRSKNLIPVLSSTTYYIKSPNGARLYFYEEDESFIKYQDWTANVTFETPSTAAYMNFTVGDAYGKVYKNDICINISGKRNGEYQPYGHK